MKALDKRLIRTILDAKAQYGAVVIIICIGLATLISLANTAQNMESSLDEYYRRYQFADLFADFTAVPLSTIRDIGKLQGVEAVETRIVTDIRADVGRDPYPTLRLVSITSDQNINRLYMQEGRLPIVDGERGIALLNAFAEANDLAVGDKIDLIIRGELFPVTITAIVDSPEYIYAIKDIKNMLPDNLNFGVGFMNLSLLQEILAMPGQANNAIISLQPGMDKKKIRDGIKDDFQGYGLKNIVLRDDQVSHALIDMEIQQLNRMSKAVPIMFLGIAALVIYMLISRLVQTDRTIIGILKATGFSNYEVMGHYLKLSLALGLAGAIGGIGIGYLMVGFVTRLMVTYFHLPLLEVQLSYGLVFIGLVLTTLFCGVTGIMAAWGVLDIAPAEAMRPASLPPGKKFILERWMPKLWDRISFSWKLVLRGILRNRHRFALAAVGVALTYAIILFAIYIFTIWDVVMDGQFGEMECYDYAVSFTNPVSSRVVVDMRSLASITTIEPFMEQPFQVAFGWHEQPILTRALPKTTNLYRFENIEGGVVILPTEGIFISQGLAKSMGIGSGDVVELSSYATGGQSYSVPVKEIVNQYLGSGIYMSLDQLAYLTGQKDIYSGVVLNSTDDIKGIFQNMGNIESVYSSADIMDTFSEYMGMIIASASFVVFLGGLLGFAILYNTTSVSIAERRREFSSLRVLGFSKNEIFQLITRENAIALAVGLIMGAPLGKTMIAGMMNAIFAGSTGEMFYFPTDISAGTYLLTAVLVTGFTVLTLITIRRKVHRLNFLEALSSRLT
ncbi:MAG: ABC transporter permease [Clostridia bacterium]|nr:ABC transporter permease [Clostridia bacterium]